jgi:hypothetical protein
MLDINEDRDHTYRKFALLTTSTTVGAECKPEAALMTFNTSSHSQSLLGAAIGLATLVMGWVSRGEAVTIDTVSNSGNAYDSWTGDSSTLGVQNYGAIA